CILPLGHEGIVYPWRRNLQHIRLIDQGFTFNFLAHRTADQGTSIDVEATVGINQYPNALLRTLFPNFHVYDKMRRIGQMSFYDLYYFLLHPYIVFLLCAYAVLTRKKTGHPDP